MFSKSIIDSDAFLEMPMSSQCLYFHLCMNADDNGNINNPNSICRYTDIPVENLDVLKNKGFTERNGTKIHVVHWDIHTGRAEIAKRRLSYEYRKWRETVLIRDNYTCQNCGNQEKIMNVHHIKPFAKYESERYKTSNGVTLCEKCHRSLHKEERLNGRKEILLAKAQA